MNLLPPSIKQKSSNYLFTEQCLITLKAIDIHAFGSAGQRARQGRASRKKGDQITHLSHYQNWRKFVRKRCSYEYFSHSNSLQIYFLFCFNRSIEDVVLVVTYFWTEWFFICLFCTRHGFEDEPHYNSSYEFQMRILRMHWQITDTTVSLSRKQRPLIKNLSVSFPPSLDKHLVKPIR